MKFKHLRTFILAGFFLGTTYAGGTAYAGEISCLYKSLEQYLYREKIPNLKGFEASVEIELKMSPEVLSILTTTTDTLEPLLKGITPPQWLQAYTKKMKLSDPARCRWDSLSDEQKILLLRDVTRARGRNAQNFYDHRAIEGLRVREGLSDGAVWGAVEYRGADQVRDVSGVELHLRGPKNAGSLGKKAWEILDAIKVPRPNLHTHMVAPLPQKITGNLDLDTALLTEFYIRVNAIAEMRDIVDMEFKIQGRHNEETIFFDSLAGDNVPNVIHFFHNSLLEKRVNLGDELKMAWVGLRGPDLYQSPINKPLWGLEYRSIFRTTNPELNSLVLNEIQARMIQNKFGITPSKLATWMAQNDSWKSGLVRSWYNRSLDALWKEAAPAVQRMHDAPMGNVLQIESRKNLAVKMLIHNWSTHPLFWNNPAIWAQIEASQVQALGSLKKDPAHSAQIVKYFLLTSGVYHQFMESIGISVTNQALEP
jgi:hypothetical protein